MFPRGETEAKQMSVFSCGHTVSWGCGPQGLQLELELSQSYWWLWNPGENSACPPPSYSLGSLLGASLVGALKGPGESLLSIVRKRAGHLCLPTHGAHIWKRMPHSEMQVRLTRGLPDLGEPQHCKEDSELLPQALPRDR